MAQGDTFEIKLSGLVLGQQVINVWHYAQLETGTSHPALADILGAWTATIRAALIGAMSAGASYQSAHLSWVIGGTELYDAVLTDWIGQLAGEALPPYACWSFLFRRLYNTTFNGHKRIPGVRETDQADGAAIGDQITRLNALATLFGSAIVIGGVLWTPVIVSRVLNGIPRTVPVINPVDVVQYRSLGTQNTRKFGRGA